MQQISLFLLGAPRLLRDGRSVATDTRKAIALLAYLALTNQPHSRDSLAALFYPDTDQSHARGALRRTLSTLNKALGGECLISSRESVSINTASGLWVDVSQFVDLQLETERHPHTAMDDCPECLLSLERSMVLYRGDFMAGFSLRDSPDFDEWQFFQAEGLRRRFAHALQVLTRANRRRGEMDKAIEYARRWLALDPLVEDAHRALMLAYSRAGQRSAALRQFQECVRVLKHELDVEPLEETRHLYQEILENRLTPESPAVTPTAGPAPLPATPGVADDHRGVQPPGQATRPLRSPMIGRELEYNRFLEHLNCTEPKGEFWVIEGEPGIGKTRLAEEMLALAADRGALTLAAGCFPGEYGLAYTPFIELIRPVLNARADKELTDIPEAWLAEVSRLVPELRRRFPGLPHPAPLNTPGALSAFYDGFRQALIHLGRDHRRIIVFIDDLQWADSATIDLLAYLTRRLHQHPLTLVASWRAEALPTQERLRAIIADTLRLGHGFQLKLNRLSRTDTVELIQRSAQIYHPGSGALSEKLVERLFDETEGLPLFLVEYLSMLCQEPAATDKPDHNPEDGIWPLPINARELIHLRVTELDELSRQILTTAAVIGRSFAFETLAAVAGRSESEAVSGLENLLARGLIVERNEPGATTQLGYDFSHEKLRTQVYEETSLVRRRLLHRRVAEHLVEQLHLTSNPEQYYGSIARHYRLAGQPADAAGYYRQAGDAARRLYANQLALEHYARAIELGYPDPTPVYESIGELHTLLGAYGPAIAAYQQALTKAKPAVHPRIHYKLGSTHQRKGEWSVAIAQYQRALENDPPPEDALAARILADWSLAALQTDQTTLAAELAPQALQRAEKASDPPTVAQAYNLLGILERRAGRFPEARRWLTKSVQIAGETGDPSIHTAALNNLALLLEELGETETAIDYTQQALELIETIGDRHRAAALHNNLADLLQHSGRPDEAMRHLKEAVAIFAQIDAGLDPESSRETDRRSAGGFRPEIWKLVEW